MVKMVIAAGFVGLLPVGMGSAAASSPEAELGIVPKPVKLELEPGSFPLAGGVRVLYQPESVGAKFTARQLADVLGNFIGAGIPVSAEGANTEGAILLTAAGAEKALGAEGYRLEVAPARVTIRAPEAAGLFYGVQTLLQLLPPEVYSPRPRTNAWAGSIPCARIEDYPRFPWRGMHLDVSRHFFGVDFVKRYLDLLALHKMNVFHWHLSDDDGWRVEIRSYPKLTRIGAWRGAKEALPPSYESGFPRYGGFYTQDQVRDIVRYAAERRILVVPELDVPAHCRAVTVAYPELLCTGDPYQFKSVQDVPANVLCPSQEQTYVFLERVFGELAELFPGPYLHAGGDERPKGPWEQCERCARRMKTEGLADGKELQDRFLKRLQGIIRARGKKMIGWDELDHATVLDPDYTVMSWNSVEAGIAAARKGYPVLMAPAPFCYFDLSYDKSPLEPGLRWAGVISVEKAYSYDPKPAALPAEVAARIVGVHGALWSETLTTPERPEYMAYPRVCALAEIGWTPQARRAWPEFWDRLSRRHFPRLDAASVAYRVPPPQAALNGSVVTILPPYAGAIVRYTLNGADPDASSTLYDKPFELPQGATLQMRTFRPNGRASRMVKGFEDSGT